MTYTYEILDTYICNSLTDIFIMLRYGDKFKDDRLNRLYVNCFRDGEFYDSIPLLKVEGKWTVKRSKLSV